jgi:murein DD-endopeptidase MepM/ murein hydrolase activator NlpD
MNNIKYAALSLLLLVSCVTTRTVTDDVGFKWPTYGRVTQDFHGTLSGPDNGYYYDANNQLQFYSDSGNFHRGFDIANSIGTPIMASKGGIAFSYSWDGEHFYGNRIVIDHGFGYYTLYAHLDGVLITDWQVVKAGEEIGKMGNTGNSTGPHLHFEIRRNGNGNNFGWQCYIPGSVNNFVISGVLIDHIYEGIE